MKFGQLIEYNIRNIFVEKLCTKYGEETITIDPYYYDTAQKFKFSRKLRIWSHLLKKSLMKNFIFE